MADVRVAGIIRDAAQLESRVEFAHVCPFHPWETDGVVGVFRDFTTENHR